MSEPTEHSEDARRPAIAHEEPRPDDTTADPPHSAAPGGGDGAPGENGEAAEMPFFPDFALREAITALCFLMGLVLISVLTKPILEEAADPMASGYIPRPEWYFMFLFQTLKYFPGELEVIGAVVIPGIAIGGLIALPFLDRRRNPRGRRLFPGTRKIRMAPRLFVVLGLAVIGTLTLKGFQASAPAATTGPSLTTVQQAGATMYEKMGCATCHRYKGDGGDRGTDLTHFASTPDAEQRVLLHFAGISPEKGSEMPAYQLSPEELHALSEYLMTFK